MTANDSDSDTYLSPAVCHQLSPAVVAAVVAAVIAAVIAAVSHEHPRRTVSQWDVVPLTRETGHSRYTRTRDRSLARPTPHEKPSQQ